MVRSAARLQADPARRQLGEELRHRTAPKLRAQHRRFGLVDPMHLKDMLGGVQTNPDNPHRTAPLLDCTITAWHYRCRRGPSTPTLFSRLGSGSVGPAFAGTTVLCKWRGIDLACALDAILREEHHARTPAGPQPDRHPRTTARDAGGGARDRAARLCRDLGVELVRQH